MQGGFLPEMTKREAALILGLRESAAEEKIKDAHKRIMLANHPDAGGSSYIAAKVGILQEHWFICDLLFTRCMGSA